MLHCNMRASGRWVLMRWMAMLISEMFAVRGYGVVVTGGASGLGLAYAEALAENGARVTLLDLEAGQVAAQALRRAPAGHAVRGPAVSVTDHATLDAAIDAAATLYGRLDVVFA